MIVRRAIGVALFLLSLPLYDPSGGLWVRLGVPLMAAVGLWLATGSLLVVAITAALLGAVHSDIGGSDPVTAFAYPAAAVLGVLTALIISLQRFRRRIKETHAARWQHRN